MHRLGVISLLFLTGCALAPVRKAEPPDSPFTRPAGSPRNPHVGFVEPAAADAEHFAIALAPNHGLRVGDIVVCRDTELRPTALLSIEQIQGRVALARLMRGRPAAKAEAVLPSSDLTKQAQALPALRPGS